MRGCVDELYAAQNSRAYSLCEIAASQSTRTSSSAVGSSVVLASGAERERRRGKPKGGVGERGEGEKRGDLTEALEGDFIRKWQWQLGSGSS